MDCFKLINRDEIEGNMCCKTKLKHFNVKTVTTTSNHVIPTTCWDWNGFKTCVQTSFLLSK